MYAALFNHSEGDSCNHARSLSSILNGLKITSRSCCYNRQHQPLNEQIEAENVAALVYYHGINLTFWTLEAMLPSSPSPTLKCLCDQGQHDQFWKWTWMCPMLWDKYQPFCPCFNVLVLNKKWGDKRSVSRVIDFPKAARLSQSGIAGAPGYLLLWPAATLREPSWVYYSNGAVHTPSIIQSGLSPCPNIATNGNT